MEVTVGPGGTEAPAQAALRCGGASSPWSPPSGFPDADGPLGDLGCRANAVSRFSSESIRAARRRMEEASGSFARHRAQLGASHLRAQTQRRRDDRVLGGTTTPRSVRS